MGWEQDQTKRDEYFMRTALELALQGRGWVSPNPVVGAVIVNESGQIIGQGYHERYGDLHAERNALKNCKEPPAARPRAVGPAVGSYQSARAGEAQRRRRRRCGVGAGPGILPCPCVGRARVRGALLLAAAGFRGPGRAARRRCARRPDRKSVV